LKKINLLKDIYYSKKYTSLYLAKGYTLFEFYYKNKTNNFYTISVKRPIDRIGNMNVNDGYYDLETAYGYGGHYCSTEDKVFLHEAFHAYQEQCKYENIVAEFIRYHPYNTFPLFNKEYLDFLAPDRQTISIDLTITNEERWAKYSTTTRNILRKAAPKLSFRESGDIYSFMKMYESTMKKNNADYFYYFSKQYLENLLAIDNVKLFAVIYDDIIINMSFIMIGKDLAHYHLSANNLNFSKLNGNYYLLDSVCDYLKDEYKDIIQFHLGGGRSNLINDSLLSFKQKFSPIKNNFYIAGTIFNNTIYKRYTEMFNSLHPELVNTKFFLKYRMNIS
jgi:hypothetical protein